MQTEGAVPQYMSTTALISESHIADGSKPPAYGEESAAPPYRPGSAEIERSEKKSLLGSA
jgi:hypothetical protein